MVLVVVVVVEMWVVGCSVVCLDTLRNRAVPKDDRFCDIYSCVDMNVLQRSWSKVLLLVNEL